MKTYKVWIEIEEYDTETQEGKTLDAPGAALAEFKAYEDAWEFVERLTASGEHCGDEWIAKVFQEDDIGYCG